MDNKVQAVSTEISAKQHFTGKVIKTSLAGAVIDIGADQPAVLHISQIVVPEGEKSKNRVEDVLETGQSVEVWVRRLKNDHIELTMNKPLDLEWRDIKSGMNVKGKVCRLEKFGVFIEIGAERPGLVHVSEIAHGFIKTPGDVLKEGEEVEAMVLDVNRRKKQIKLSLKALQPEPEIEASLSRVSEKMEDKPKRGKKSSPRGKGDFETNKFDSEEAAAEPEPTVMELALKAAMEKSNKARPKNTPKGKKEKLTSSAQEDILARTLNNKVQTS